MHFCEANKTRVLKNHDLKIPDNGRVPPGNILGRFVPGRARHSHVHLHWDDFCLWIFLNNSYTSLDFFRRLWFQLIVYWLGKPDYQQLDLSQWAPNVPDLVTIIKYYIKVCYHTYILQINLKKCEFIKRKSIHIWNPRKQNLKDIYISKIFWSLLNIKW